MLGLAEDPGADPVFKNGLLDMDVFYRAGETQQVNLGIENRFFKNLRGMISLIFILGSLIIFLRIQSKCSNIVQSFFNFFDILGVLELLVFCRVSLHTALV